VKTWVLTPNPTGELFQVAMMLIKKPSAATQRKNAMTAHIISHSCSILQGKCAVDDQTARSKDETYRWVETPKERAGGQDVLLLHSGALGPSNYGGERQRATGQQTSGFRTGKPESVCQKG